MATSRPIDDTYAEVERLVYSAVHRFIRRHGGDFDDLVGLANQVYMDSYDGYDPSKGSFSNYLWVNITRRLQDFCRAERSRKEVSLSSPCGNGRGVIGDFIEDRRAGTDFDLAEFARRMTEDAKTVIELVLDAPEDLKEIAEGKGGHYYNFRSSLRGWLHSRKGWSVKRISEAFEEISEVLAAT